VLLAWEGARNPADARRALLARFVLEHRLSPKDPLEPEAADWEAPAIAALLEDVPVPLARVSSLLAAA
jgi:acyl-CoA dehydrogenase